MSAQTGVTGSFCAEHDDPRGIKPRHWHCWKVRAWFPAGEDARDHVAALDRALGLLEGEFLHPSLAWGEAIAQSIGEILPGCIEIEIEREGERILARWRAE